MSKHTITIRRTEHSEQSAVIDWRNANIGAMPELRWLHAIPNGGARSISVAVQLKMEGVTRGIADLFWPLKRHDYCGLYIEMKMHPNKPTPEQLEFMQYAHAQGYCALVCYSADEAIDALKWYYTYDGIPF